MISGAIKIRKNVKTQKENLAKQILAKLLDEKYYKYELFTKENINRSYIIYEILVCQHQYSIYIYIIYISIFLYPLKYIKAAAIGQSEELFCPILNCLNILQPYSEDTEIKTEEEKRKNKLIHQNTR